MYDKFADYMWYLLTTPMKKVQKAKNQWYLYFKVMGKWFDECLEDIYVAREEIMIATCRQEMLTVHGSDRKLTRYGGETWDNYRYRIATYEELKQLGGTNAGVLLAAKALGFQDVEIVRAVALRADPERWAEFYLILPFDADEAYPIDIGVLKKEVRKVKEVGALDNYLLQFTSQAEQTVEYACATHIISDFFPRNPMLLLDGSWKLNGQELLGDIDSAQIELYPLEMNIFSGVSVEVEHESELILEKDLWYLDGAELLDGSRSLASEIIHYNI